MICLGTKRGNGGGGSGGSYTEIGENQTVVIPVGQQMIVDGHISVLGHLSVLGSLVDISARQPEQFFYTRIDDVVVVYADRYLAYKSGNLLVDGHLRVVGDLWEL